ncbi:MAG: hypothetical protein HY805_01855 [Nitrospirae bacterium]|nr:hypothetical protein [Nitrospirota bacterium]
MKKYKPIDIRKIKTYPIKDRMSKIEANSISCPHKKGGTFEGFISSLPDILAVKDLKAVVAAIIKARKNKRHVILGMGAHPIKVGLSPIIIDLIKRGIITGVAANGACIIHDFELSFIGRTSEDVAEGLHKGIFGMAEETGRLLNQAIKQGVDRGLGIGESIGEFIHKGNLKYKDLSIFRAGYKEGIPMTVHVAIGADIIHMHPSSDGSAIGMGSMRDFLILANVLCDLEGGVYINLGSAVILPEVFLKALTMARNLGNKVEDITTVNMDFIQQYRARENVLRRPTMLKGASYALTGHHEIMFSLLSASVIEGIK